MSGGSDEPNHHSLCNTRGIDQGDRRLGAWYNSEARLKSCDELSTRLVFLEKARILIDCKGAQRTAQRARAVIQLVASPAPPRCICAGGGRTLQATLAGSASNASRDTPLASPCLERFYVIRQRGDC